MTEKEAIAKAMLKYLETEFIEIPELLAMSRVATTRDEENSLIGKALFLLIRQQQQK